MKRKPTRINANPPRSEVGLNSRRAIFPRFFDPKNIGSSLREVSPSLLSSESDELTGRWFHSSEEADLFLWSDLAGKIVKQQLTFFDQVVEWNVVEGTQTGVVNTAGGKPRSGAGQTAETIRFDEHAEPQPLSLAMDLVKHISALSEDEQKEIVTNFFRGQKAQRRHADAFHELYGRRTRTQSKWLVYLTGRLKGLGRIFRKLFRPY